MDKHSEKFLSSFTAKQLVDVAMARRDPEAAKSLYMLTSYKEPQFVKSWHEQASATGAVIDDLVDVMEWMREDKLFAQADRLRTLIGRLSRVVGNGGVMTTGNEIREIAKTWPDQLSIKESKKILTENEQMKAIIKKMGVSVNGD